MAKKDKSNKIVGSSKIVSDTRGLRWLLLVCIDDLANSRITPNKANAMSNVANSIMDSMRLEMVSTRIGGSGEYEPLELARLPEEEVE
jgi:hypothetical protein